MDKRKTQRKGDEDNWETDSDCDQNENINPNSSKISKKRQNKIKKFFEKI